MDGGLEGFEVDFGGGDGEEGVGAGAVWESEQGSDDLVDGVVADDAAAVEAGDGAAAGVEEAEVVVDLGGGGDGGAGIARLIFLLDGDGGGEAVHVVDIGLFDALQELAGVGGERFDVAALAFGVDGVEGEGRFAGAGDAADDGERVVGDVDVDGFEVVGARAADDDGVVGLGRRGALAFFDGVHCWDLGKHGHSLLSDRWAGIANQAEREWVLQGAVHRLTCCRHPREVWVRCGLKVVGGKVGKLRVFFHIFKGTMVALT